MGTDNDVGKPAFRSDAWYAARTAEAKAHLQGVNLRRYDRLVDACGVDVEALSPKAQSVLVWLAGWEEPTIEGVIELLAVSRRVADLACMVDAIDVVDDRPEVGEADVVGDLLAAGKLDGVPFDGAA